MRYLISSIPKIHIPPKTVDPRRVRTVSGLFLPKIKKGATTHDEEENATFATVSGQCNNPTNPEALYRKCGFTGSDVWHVLRKR